MVILVSSPSQIINYKKPRSEKNLSTKIKQLQNVPVANGRIGQKLKERIHELDWLEKSQKKDIK